MAYAAIRRHSLRVYSPHIVQRAPNTNTQLSFALSWRHSVACARVALFVSWLFLLGVRVFLFV